MQKKVAVTIPASLPDFLKGAFWDIDFSTLSWDLHQDFIIKRVLSSGNWQSVEWLRENLGEERLRAWLLDKEGAGLEARRLRYWQFMLDITPIVVDEWIARDTDNPWNSRHSGNIKKYK